MSSSPDSPQVSGENDSRLPLAVPITVLALGIGVLAILILARIPMRTLREFLWGVGSGFMFTGLAPLLFPEMRRWRPRTPLPFQSRVRYACFLLYLILGTLVVVYAPAAKSLGLWTLWPR